MKIPGLDEITKNMEQFADMLPVLESINNNLDKLVTIQVLAVKMQTTHQSPDYRRLILDQLKDLGV